MKKKADFNTDLEFRTLLLAASQDLKEITYENCHLEKEDDNTITVDFNNYVDYTSAKKNQYYIYSLDQDSCSDDTYRLRLRLKPGFVAFENKYWSDLGKRGQNIMMNLMSITISIPLKRMIMFFYNLRDEDVLKYFEKCSENMKESIRHYFQLLSTRKN